MATDDKYIQFFKETDKDGSGYLTVEELTAMLRRLGYKTSDDQIEKMFQSFDASGDNKVSLDEYLQAMGRVPPQNHKSAAMRSVFRKFDKNGDGSIDKSELHAVFKEMGRVLSQDEIDRLFKMCDADGSGLLNYEEFIAKVFGKSA